jgi:hypothetical protein
MLSEWAEREVALFWFAGTDRLLRWHLGEEWHCAPLQRPEAA